MDEVLLVVVRSSVLDVVDRLVVELVITVDVTVVEGVVVVVVVSDVASFK